MASRLRASPEQFSTLLEFMESHGDIARPQQGAQGRIKSDRLWQQLGELLNSIGGGVIKSIERWKKVWADWKTKTKKKALAIRREASGTGGGPSSRQTLTAYEERVLSIMGLSAVIGQARIEERGFDDLPSAAISLPPQFRDFNRNERHSQTSATNQIMMDTIQSHSIEVTALSATPSLPTPYGELPCPTIPVSTPPPAPAPVTVPSTTIPPTSPGAPRRRRRAASPSPTHSPTTSTPRRRRLIQTRRRRVQTPFERATSEFVAIEQRRLQLEEDREKRNHEREMERLRIESRAITMEEQRTEVLNKLTSIVANFTNILPQLIPSSLPSTDILS